MAQNDVHGDAVIGADGLTTGGDAGSTIAGGAAAGAGSNCGVDAECDAGVKTRTKIRKRK